MTPATKTIIAAALTADSTITANRRDEIMRLLDGATDAANDPDIRTFSEPEAAKRLRVSRATVARMKRDGILKTRCVRGVNRITAASLFAV